MPALISESQAARLRKVVKHYKRTTSLGKPWTKWTDDALLRKVLVQVAVIGRAAPGERLQRDRKVSVKKLSSFRSTTDLQKYLHKLFSSLEVRFSLGCKWNKDWKATACARNFEVLREMGGPTKFFCDITKIKSEKQRIKELQDRLYRYGDKGARDTLIELRLAEDCMALDTRIFGVLKKVKVRASPKDIYIQIEKELREKVAEPLKIRAALLDRILFKNYKFNNKKDLTRKLKRWETEYNEDRPHLALAGKTPAERVHELAQPPKSAKDLS
jgi:hypothetical protein